MLCCDADYSVILPNLIIYGEEMRFLFITELTSDSTGGSAHSWADLGFLDRGSKGVRAIRGYFGPPIRSKNKSCLSQVSSYWFFRTITKV